MKQPKVSLATLALARAPAIVLDPWRAAHAPGDNVPLPEAVNWFATEATIEAAEWVLLEVTPPEPLLTWVSTSLGAIMRRVPATHKDRAQAILDSIAQGISLPQRFWREWDAIPKDPKHEAHLYAFRMGGHVLAWGPNDAMLRSGARTFHGALLGALRVQMPAATPQTLRLRALELAIPAMESAA